MPRRLLASILALTLLGACATPPGVARLSAGQSVDIANAGAQLSVQRAGSGMVRPLVHNPALQGAAQAHADDLVRSGQLGHTGSDGSTVQTRVERVGYRACRVAENVAQGQADVGSVVSDWMASTGHRANILDPQVTQFGFARSFDTWVLVLARPC